MGLVRSTSVVWFKIVGMFFLLAILILVTKLIFFPVNIAGTVMNTAGQVMEKTLEADNVIYNYEFFHTVAREIQATERKIRNAENLLTSTEAAMGPRSEWTFEDKTENARQRSILMGLRNHIEDQVALYNSRSAMINRRIFRGRSLPPTIIYDGGTNTSSISQILLGG